jgi:hypothetical protein
MALYLRGALCALACTVAAPAWAKPLPPMHFSDCDGYGAPNAHFDGLRSSSGLIVKFSVSGHPVPIVIGRTGVQACDTALADPALLDTYWMRRVTLLRARAIHKLAAGDDAGALEDVAKAREAMKDESDLLVRRSLGLGLDLVRAYALSKTNHVDEARKLAAAVLAERPYNRHVGMAVAAVVGNEGLRAGDSAVLKTLGRLDPRFVDAMFELAFDEGRFDEAIRLHPHIAPPVKGIDEGRDKEETAYQMARRDSQTLMHTAERRARLAYALAATGHGDKARAELAAAKALIAEHPVPTTPPPPPPGQKEDRKAREARTRASLAVIADTEAGAFVTKWEKLVEWRLGLEGADADKIIPQINPNGLSLNGAHVDLLSTANRKRPSSELAALAKTLAGRIAAPPDDRHSEAKMLFEGLPQLEVRKTVSGYQQSHSLFAILWGGISGFKTIGDPKTGKATVEYLGQNSSSMVVEEMALLRAADLARQNGHSGFLITGRRDYHRQLVFGRDIRNATEDGFSTQLDVEFVDLAALPPKLATAPWRVLSADDVLNTLGPVYAAPKAPAK